MYYRNDYDLGYDYISGEYVYGDERYTPDEYIGERWLQIPEAPDYLISDMGRIWSEKSQQFVKQKPLDKHGHMGVCLYVNGYRRYFYIHRLMAKAFISNPNNYPVVRHLNDNPKDNCLENFAWGTQRDNAEDAKRNGRTSKCSDEIRDRVAQSQRKPIIATNIKTCEKIFFRGQNEASRILQIQQSNIWKVLNGKRKSTCGYYFEYVNDGDVYERN